MTVTATMDKPAQGVVSITVWAEPWDGVGARVDSYRMSANTVLTFAAGDTTSTGVVQVIAVDNDADEDGATKDLWVWMKVTTGNALMSSGVGGLAPEVSTRRRIFISNDDDAPTVTLNLSSSAISEDGGTTEITATLSHPTWWGDMQLDAQVGFYRSGTHRATAEDVELSQNSRLGSRTANWRAPARLRSPPWTTMSSMMNSRSSPCGSASPTGHRPTCVRGSTPLG
ncbi:hypothetical protein [Candidatus Palauibacter sp.]|uniref:hypothetical protein n=1 Tax=Candidatus Palauibacter sp. TaxID=3101350 RepID=UPI003B5194F8